MNFEMLPTGREEVKNEEEEEEEEGGKVLKQTV